MSTYLKKLSHKNPEIPTLFFGLSSAVLAFVQPLWMDKFLNPQQSSQLIFLIGFIGIVATIGSFGQSSGLLRYASKPDSKISLIDISSFTLILNGLVSTTIALIWLKVSKDSYFSSNFTTLISILFSAVLFSISRYGITIMRLHALHLRASVLDQCLKEVIFISLVFLFLSKEIDVNVVFLFFVSIAVPTLITVAELIKYRCVSPRNIFKNRKSIVKILGIFKSNIPFLFSDLGPMFFRKIDLVAAPLILPPEFVIKYFFLTKLSEIGPFLMALLSSSKLDRFVAARKTANMKEFWIIFRNVCTASILVSSVGYASLISVELVFTNLFPLPLLQFNSLIILSIMSGLLLSATGPMANTFAILNKQNSLITVTISWLVVHTSTITILRYQEFADIFICFSLISPVIYKLVLGLCLTLNLQNTQTN